MVEKIREISRILESSMRLSCIPSKGVLFSQNSALVKYITEEPYQSQGRDFTKFYNIPLISLSHAKSEYYSPSKNLRILIRGEKEDEQYFEVWDQKRLRIVKELKKVHSSIIESPVFGDLSWSSDERYVTYIAESLKKKSSSFWSGEENAGNANIYKETYGERCSNVSDPKLFVFDLHEDKIFEIELKGDFFPAQPVIQPNSHNVVVVGYKKTPYKLGIAAMLNREARLFKADIITKEVTEIAIQDSLLSAQFPKFNSSGTYLSYYGVPKGKRSHMTCNTLNVINWATNEISCIVDTVEDFNENFNGIYGFHETLSTYKWLNDEKIIFETAHKGSNCIFTVDISGKLSEYVYDLPKPYHLALLDATQNTALIRAANIINFPKLLVINFSNNEYSTTIIDDLTPTPSTPEEQKIIDTLTSASIGTISHQSSSLTSFVYYTSVNNPLVIVPHGGPHNFGDSDFLYSLVFKLALGYNILIPNFRGSTGYGNKLVDALLGNVGRVDVSDCLEAILLSKQYVSTEYVISSGRSHGGFLSSHLASTGVPKLSVVINGVTDISSMSLTTDITDWAFAEVFNEDPTFPPNDNQIAEMYRASPISRAGNINIPVLIIAGGSDKRVPSFNSMELYRVLKGKGNDVKLFWYEKDDHRIATKSSVYDYLVNEAVWLEEKRKGEDKN